MSWASKEQKGDLALMGAGLIKGVFEGFAQESSQRRQKALSDNHITRQEYDQVYNEMIEYRSQIENLLLDCELGNRFSGTNDAFLTIVKIIMYDLEYDYPEVLQNFSRYIDTEEFIENHNESLDRRKDRLEREYQGALIEYEAEFKDYQIQLEHHKAKGFFQRMVSEIANPPSKPKRRE